MQTQNRFFDELAKVAGTGVSMAMKAGSRLRECAGEAKGSSYTQPQDAHQVQDTLDRIYEMVSNTRSDMEELKEKVAALEEKMKSNK